MKLEEFRDQYRAAIDTALNDMQTVVLLLAQAETKTIELGHSLQGIRQMVNAFFAEQSSAIAPELTPKLTMEGYELGDRTGAGATGATGVCVAAGAGRGTGGRPVGDATGAAGMVELPVGLTAGAAGGAGGGVAGAD
jgi:hypothetical protein